MGVHPFAQVAEDLLAGLPPMQRLQPGPFLRLGGADESQHGLGKDRPLAVEAVLLHGHVAVAEKLGFDDGFEGSFTIPLVHTFAPSARLSGCGAREPVVKRSLGVGLLYAAVTIARTRRHFLSTAYPPAILLCRYPHRVQ